MPQELSDPYPREEQPCVDCGGSVVTTRGSIARHGNVHECLAHVVQRLADVESTMNLLLKTKKVKP